MPVASATARRWVRVARGTETVTLTTICSSAAGRDRRPARGGIARILEPPAEIHPRLTPVSADELHIFDPEPLPVRAVSASRDHGGGRSARRRRVPKLRVSRRRLSGMRVRA
jgi:hypothetical protein